MNKVPKHLIILLSGMMLILPVLLIRKKKENGKNFKDRLSDYLTGPIPDTIYFCNQKVQHISWNIRQTIINEFQRHVEKSKEWKYHFKRCQLWKPIIEKILNQNQLPTDLFYVCVTESKCSNVISPAGAAGFWQLIPSTAKKYGLNVDSCLDERYHPIKSTEAVCRHFKYLYHELHDWGWVCVAYNAGLERVKSMIERQNTSRIDNTKMNLESKQFLYRVLSLKYLFEHPDYFNVKVDSNKLSLKFSSMKIKNSSHLSKIILKHPLWKKMNPWVLCSDLPNVKVNEIIIFHNDNLSPDFIYGNLKTSESSLPDTISANNDSIK
ncbi:MAG: lytic transglycosylase domain-containing protein [Bacteroidia bacterium]|nr:lytic transglycosylase domain-containing protein [Bacteroidia bacterium]